MKLTVADCKLSQFIKQPKICFVNKRARVIYVFVEKQQMALVVCQVVYINSTYNAAMPNRRVAGRMWPFSLSYVALNNFFELDNNL